jgi:hypothetical protein
MKSSMPEEEMHESNLGQMSFPALTEARFGHQLGLAFKKKLELWDFLSN